MRTGWFLRYPSYRSVYRSPNQARYRYDNCYLGRGPRWAYIVKLKAVHSSGQPWGHSPGDKWWPFLGKPCCRSSFSCWLWPLCALSNGELRGSTGGTEIGVRQLAATFFFLLRQFHKKNFFRMIPATPLLLPLQHKNIMLHVCIMTQLGHTVHVCTQWYVTVFSYARVQNLNFL